MIETAAYSVPGMGKKNEDAVEVCQTGHGCLAIAADGLEGAAGGTDAALAAVQRIRETLDGAPFCEGALRQAVRRANEAVYGAHSGGKSAVAVVWICEDRALCVNVGDTRIYQIRGEQAVYRSKDHNLAQLFPESSGALRHILYQALGGGPYVKTQIRRLALQPEDCILLCTDGFWSQVPEWEILRAAQTHASPRDCLAALRRAMEPDSERADDCSAIVVRIF